MGPSLLSFGLDTGVGGYLPEKRKIPSMPVCGRIYYKKDQLGFSFFAAGKHPIPSRGEIFGVVLGGTGGVKIGTVFLKKLGSDLVVQSSR